MGGKLLGGLAALILGAATAGLLGCGAAPAAAGAVSHHRPSLTGERAGSMPVTLPPAIRESPPGRPADQATPAPLSEPSPAAPPAIRITSQELSGGVIACGPRKAACPPG